MRRPGWLGSAPSCRSVFATFFARAESALAKAFGLDSHNPVLRQNLAECRYRQALVAVAKGDESAARERLAAALAVLPDLRLRAASEKRLAKLLEGAPTPPG